MNLEYATKWCNARSNDIDAFAELYAPDEDFAMEFHMMDDHMQDTVSTHAAIKERLTDLTNADAENGKGIHTFTATLYEGDERWGMIQWDYKAEGADSYRGLDNPDRKTLETKGSTFLRFNADGKIILDSTVMNDNPIFQALGLPIMTPHYWEEGFDPASLMAG